MSAKAGVAWAAVRLSLWPCTANPGPGAWCYRRLPLVLSLAPPACSCHSIPTAPLNRLHMSPPPPKPLGSHPTVPKADSQTHLLHAPGDEVPFGRVGVSQAPAAHRTAHTRRHSYTGLTKSHQHPRQSQPTTSSSYRPPACIPCPRESAHPGPPAPPTPHPAVPHNPRNLSIPAPAGPVLPFLSIPSSPAPHAPTLACTPLLLSPSPHVHPVRLSPTRCTHPTPAFQPA